MVARDQPKVGREDLCLPEPGKVAHLDGEGQCGDLGDSLQAGDPAGDLLVPGEIGEFRDPSFHFLQPVRRVPVRGDVFLEGGAEGLGSDEPVEIGDVGRRPVALAGEDLSEAEAEGDDCLLQPFQLPLVESVEADVFPHSEILVVRDVDGLEGVIGEVPCQEPGIQAVRLLLAVVSGLLDRREGHDDAIDPVGGQVLLEAVAAAPGLVSADELSLMAEAFGDGPEGLDDLLGGALEGLLGEVAVASRDIATGGEGSLVDIDADVNYTFHGGILLKLWYCHIFYYRESKRHNPRHIQYARSLHIV